MDGFFSETNRRRREEAEEVVDQMFDYYTPQNPRPETEQPPFKRVYKRKEDTIVADLMAYIDKTYGAHYAGANNIQTIDVWDSLGIMSESCQSNVLKYTMRYGKKNGRDEADLMKVLHYTVLWIATERARLESEGQDRG